MSTLDITDLQRRLRAFAAERDWDQYHSPKNLAMALSVEAAELLELYQWLTPAESTKAIGDSEFASALADELADILIYLVRLADICAVDIPTAVDHKLDKNSEKHPPKHSR